MLYKQYFKIVILKKKYFCDFKICWDLTGLVIIK